jgi:hypothetical protein
LVKTGLTYVNIQHFLAGVNTRIIESIFAFSASYNME